MSTYLSYYINIPNEKAKEAEALIKDAKLDHVMEVEENENDCGIWMKESMMNTGSAGAAIDLVDKIAPLLVGSELDNQMIIVDGGMPGESWFGILSRGVLWSFNMDEISVKEDPHPGDHPHLCQGCGKTWKDEETVFPIPKIYERVSPNDPMPSGECPECHSLTHYFDPKKAYFSLVFDMMRSSPPGSTAGAKVYGWINGPVAVKNLKPPGAGS